MTRQQFFPLFVIMLAAGMAFCFTGAFGDGALSVSRDIAPAARTAPSAAPRARCARAGIGRLERRPWLALMSKRSVKTDDD